MAQVIWQKYVPALTWGAEIEYDPEFVSMLRGKALSDADYALIENTIATQERESYVHVPSLGCELIGFDWTTDLGDDDDPTVHAGYCLSFSDDDTCDSYGIPLPRLCLLIEWDDDFSRAAGVDRTDQAECVRVALDMFREFLAIL